MPFKSEKQQKYMFMKHPKIAKKWAKKYGTVGNPKNLAKMAKKANKSR